MGGNMVTKKRIEQLITKVSKELYWASKFAEDEEDKKVLENDLKDLLDYYAETFGEKYQK